MAIIVYPYLALFTPPHLIIYHCASVCLSVRPSLPTPYIHPFVHPSIHPSIIYSQIGRWVGRWVGRQVRRQKGLYYAYISYISYILILQHLATFLAIHCEHRSHISSVKPGLLGTVGIHQHRIAQACTSRHGDHLRCTPSLATCRQTTCQDMSRYVKIVHHVC